MVTSESQLQAACKVIDKSSLKSLILLLANKVKRSHTLMLRVSMGCGYARLGRHVVAIKFFVGKPNGSVDRLIAFFLPFFHGTDSYLG